MNNEDQRIRLARKWCDELPDDEELSLVVAKAFLRIKQLLAYIDEHESAWHGGDDCGEHCHVCGRGYRYVYRVPDNVWRQIAPVLQTSDMDLNGLLCIDCAAARAREIGIELYFEGSEGDWYSNKQKDAVAAEREEIQKQLYIMMCKKRDEANSSDDYEEHSSLLGDMEAYADAYEMVKQRGATKPSAGEENND